MKIKKIVDVGKQKGAIRIYDQRTRDGDIDMQWLNAGRAIYPLYEVPLFDAVSIARTYDIRPDKVAIDHEPSLPENICFADAIDAENAVEKLDITLCVNGVTLYPYVTQQGVAFMDEKSISPLGKERDKMCVFERYTSDKKMYFAVKCGFELAALILPYDAAVTPHLLTELKTLQNLTELALANKGVIYNEYSQ